MKKKSLEEKFNKWFIETNQEINDELDFEGTKEEVFQDFCAGYNLSQKEMQEKLDQERVIERAYLIENNSLEERSQEATHYNWLDDQNEKLQNNLDEAVEVIRFYADVNTWTSDNTHDPERVVIKEMDFHCTQEEGIIGGKRAREYFEKYKGRE